MVEERLDVRFQLSPSNVVGFRDVNRRRPAELPTVGFATEAPRLFAIHHLIAQHQLDRTEGDDKRIFARRIGRPGNCLGGTLRWNPDRRMRLLIRTRPGIGVSEGVVLALMVDRARFGPRLHNQIVGLAKSLVRIDRIDAGGMVFGADASHKAGDNPAVRNVVEHRVFFGDVQRIIHQRQGAAEDRHFHIAVARAVDQNATR